VTDSAYARRMRLLEHLASTPSGGDLHELAAQLGVDDRTIRRDIDYVHGIARAVGGVHIARGHVSTTGWPNCLHDPGGRAIGPSGPKRDIARAAVRRIPDGAAVVLSAGTTTHAVASAIRRAAVLGEPPHEPIVFTNSLPALLELIAAGLSTGVVGEVYIPADASFHAEQVRSRFHASLAIVGASGIIIDPAGAGLELCSDRMDESAFMGQLLASIPEILVVAEPAKIGRRHPWSFTSDGQLRGKTVHMVTGSLDAEQASLLESLSGSAIASGFRFTYEVAPCAE